MANFTVIMLRIIIKQFSFNFILCLDLKIMKYHMDLEFAIYRLIPYCIKKIKIKPNKFQLAFTLIFIIQIILQIILLKYFLHIIHNLNFLQ